MRTKRRLILWLCWAGAIGTIAGILCPESVHAAGPIFARAREISIAPSVLRRVTPPFTTFPNYWIGGFGTADPSTIQARSVGGDATPLMARAIAFRDDQGTKVIVSADILAFPSSAAASILNKVRVANSGFPTSNLLLYGSHTHNGPVLPAQPNIRITYGFPDETHPTVDAYAESLATAVANLVNNVISDVAAASAPVSIKYGLSRINRPATQLPSGAFISGSYSAKNRAVAWGSASGIGQIDPDVPVLVVREAGIVKAVLFGYSMHAITRANIDRGAFDWDYPGETANRLKRQPGMAGTIALYVPGAGGDQDPDNIQDTNRDMAANLVSAVMRVVNNEAGTGTVDAGTVITTGVQTVSLPFDINVSKNPGLLNIYQPIRNDSNVARRAHAHIMVNRILAGTLSSAASLPVFAWKFSGGAGKPLTLLALGGEPVVDFAIGFRKILAWTRNVWFSGYANALAGYIPSDEIVRLHAQGLFRNYEASYEFTISGQRIPGSDSAGLYNDGWPAPLREGAGALICGAVGNVLSESLNCSGFPQARLLAKPVASWQAGVGVAPWSDGASLARLSLFASGSGGGGCIWQRDWAGQGDGAAAGQWGSWSSGAGCVGATSSPSTVAWRDSLARVRFDVAVRDTNGLLRRRSCVGTTSGCSTWQAWESVGAPPPGFSRALSLTTWKQLDNVPRLDVFVRGNDGCYWHRGWIGSSTIGEAGTWHAWSAEPGCGGLRSAPAAVSWRDGAQTIRHDVFAVDNTNKLWQRTCSGNDFACSWSSWMDRGVVANAGAGDPSAVVWTQQDGTPRMDLFLATGDTCYWHRAWVGPGVGTWNAWVPEPGCGGFAGAPAGAAAWRDLLGRVHLAVIGADSSGSLWHKGWLGDDVSGNWTGWTKIAPSTGGF